MDGFGIDAAFFQFFGNAVGAVFGSSEDDHLGQIRVIHDVGQKPGLFGGGDMIDALRDAFDRCRLRRHLDPDRVNQDFAGQTSDFVRHGRRKQQRLAFFWQGRDDLADIAHKAHVEHPVGLVEDQEFGRAQLDMALVHQVEQTAGRGDNDIDAAGECLDLPMLADATEDHGMVQLQVLAVGAELLADLDRQFTGRRQYQGARLTCAVFHDVLRQFLENGQRKGARLAGTGLGNAQHVPAFKKLRNGLSLDRRRRGVVTRRQGALERIG